MTGCRDPEVASWEKAGPTSSSCSSWDALLPPGAGGAAPPSGSGNVGTPCSSTTRAGAHAAGGRAPRAPPGGAGCCDLREKPPSSPSSERVSEPEEDSAEEAPIEDEAAAAGARVRAPWPLQPRATGSGASETFSPISQLAKVLPEVQREPRALSTSGEAAGCWARARSHCRSQAPGSPASHYVATAGPREPATKLAVAWARRPTGTPARGDMPAQIRAMRSTVLPRCAGAAGTAASRAKPASGTHRRRRAAPRTNGKAGAPMGGGCGAPGGAGVR